LVTEDLQQTNEQVYKLVLLAIFIISRRFAHLFTWASSEQCFFNHV